jgi:predicted amidohydrolase
MKEGEMRVSVIQMSPGADKEANIAAAERLIGEACKEDRPELVSLPEMWMSLGGDRERRFANAESLPPPGSEAPTAGAEAYETLRRLARHHRIFIHGGSLIEKDEAERGRLFNTTVLFDPEGREIARYRKIHLFDITTPDGTGYRESATYGAGEAIVTARCGAFVAGLSICYDIRFPELYQALRLAGAEVIFVPAAFTLQTGKDHWEVLLRARAIETQCWIVAAATFGRFEERGEPRATYGHAMIVDPWGQVVAMVPDGVGFATARLDRARLTRIRRDMPVIEHRRPHLWGR